MAWLTKNTGTMKIDRRPEPYLTPAMRQELTERILPRYAMKQGATLPALHMIQHKYGWIPAQAIEEIAALLELKPADVLDTASFYEEYWLKPRGDRLVSVCRSIACEFCGQKEITQACKDKLGIEVGETTDDGKFTLIEIECVGSCGTAPAMLVDEALHENLTPGDVGKILDEAGKRTPHHEGHGRGGH